MDARKKAHQPLPYPYSPTLVDIEVRNLGGTTTAFDMAPENIQAMKAPISNQERLVELSRENGRLRQEALYFRNLTREVMPLLSVLRYHLDGLSSTVRQCNEMINQANAQWEVEENKRSR